MVRLLNRRTIENLNYIETVDKIVIFNNHIRTFWSRAEGWAPIKAADLLSKSRLDWLVSLSHSLYNWKEETNDNAIQGDLILAWANLGALVEGNMKFFLSVYYEDYKADKNIPMRWNKQVDPDSTMMNELILFFNKSIWDDTEKEDKSNWLKEVQQKRNAIHAYKDRDIGNFHLFRQHVKTYLLFLLNLLSRVPYPDDIYGPDLSF